MAILSVQEALLPSFDSTSQPPSLFDGTTRLYINYQGPYAQRVWITRNIKVPSLEHNNKVIGESLDLIKYVDNNFEGPSLLPDDPEKQRFAEELIAYSGTFVKEVYGSFKGDAKKQAGAQIDYLEKALYKFDDGPFFLGHELSQVDIAYVPFIERFHFFLQEMFNYDIMCGRPKLVQFMEEVNKIDGYEETKVWDPKILIEHYKSRYMV